MWSTPPGCDQRFRLGDRPRAGRRRREEIGGGGTPEEWHGSGFLHRTISERETGNLRLSARRIGSGGSLSGQGVSPGSMPGNLTRVVVCPSPPSPDCQFVAASWDCRIRVLSGKAPQSGCTGPSLPTRTDLLPRPLGRGRLPAGGKDYFETASVPSRCIGTRTILDPAGCGQPSAKVRSCSTGWVWRNNFGREPAVTGVGRQGCTPFVPGHSVSVDLFVEIILRECGG